MKKREDLQIERREIVSPIGTICLEADEEALLSLYIIGSPAAVRWEQAEAQEGSLSRVKAACLQTNGDEEGLSGALETAGPPEKDTAQVIVEQAGQPEKCAAQAILDQTEKELREYFCGLRQTFGVPIRMRGTEFQQKVWGALREIPYGETRTYAEVAQMIGNPKACRAVGGANNRNPVMILTPCHRVVGSDGSLVGFGGGLDAKKYLLELEQQVQAGNVVRECGAQDNCTDTVTEDGQKDYGKTKLASVEESCWETVSGKAEDSGEIDGKVKETQAAYRCKKQGEYTLEDYYAWPEDERIELIDGYIFKMDAPTIAHQIVGFQICMKLSSYIDSQKGNCLPLVSPVDVQLDRDDKTMLQPDVLVVCDRDKVINRCIYGAPEFIVEVLSASSVRKDTVIKLNKYKNAGVQEYWVVDLKSRHVIVHDFANDRPVQIYGMDNEIPAAIFGGECRISFAQIYEKVEFLLEGTEDAE